MATSWRDADKPQSLRHAGTTGTRNSIGIEAGGTRLPLAEMIVNGVKIPKMVLKEIDDRMWKSLASPESL